MNGIVIACSVCSLVLIKAAGEVQGMPVIRALCDECQKSITFQGFKTQESLELDTKFEELIKDL